MDGDYRDVELVEALHVWIDEAIVSEIHMVETTNYRGNPSMERNLSLKGIGCWLFDVVRKRNDAFQWFNLQPTTLVMLSTLKALAAVCGNILWLYTYCALQERNWNRISMA